MSYRERPPHPALRAHVDRLWWRVTDGARDPVNLTSRTASSAATMASAPSSPSTAANPALILPDGCIDVLINLSTGVARVVGTMTRAVAYSASPLTSLAAVRFMPGAAASFFRCSADELTDRELHVEELGLDWLPRSAFDGSTPLRALADLERRLLERVGSVTIDPAIGHATRRLYGEHPPRVEELARELGYSRQHLRRGFREHVGVSPKQFAQVARLQRAVDHLQGARTSSLALAAVQLGYCDQAHMSHEFRELAGITPRQARDSRGSISPIRSLWLRA
jgi:AraC-like DNA-binding protein